MKDHLTTVELAARWGVAKGTIENWRIRGCGPQFVKIGKKVFYPLHVVIAWETDLKSSTSQTGVSICYPGVT